MQICEIIISASITLFSIGLLSLSLISSKIYKSYKLTLITLVFIVFVVKGILLSASLFLAGLEGISTTMYWHIFDMIVLSLLFFTTLKKT
jgi:hypothetical protein